MSRQLNKKMEFKNFDANSKAGRKVLDSSRKLEDGFDENAVAQYSIAYDSCHNTTTWGENGYTSTPLVKFTLCPTKYIHSGRCFSNSVGKYVIDVNTFMDSYLDYNLESLRRTCEDMRENCGCGDGDDDGCIYHCYNNYGQSWSDLNCDEALQDEEEVYGECSELEVPEQEGDDRRLAEDDKEDKLYMGPYCGAGGKGIFLTLFNDQYCNYITDDAAEVYESLFGESMPYQYSSNSRGLVKTQWISCAENREDENGDQDNDADDVNEFCEEVYQVAGKCEQNMTNQLQYPNTMACDYINSLNPSAVAYQLSDSMNGVAWGALFGVSVALSAFGGAKLFLKNKKKYDTKTSPLV